MMYAIKFDSLEARENFREFCEYVGWNWGFLNGAINGHWVETDGKKDDNKQIEYLHGLGAFKYYDE